MRTVPELFLAQLAENGDRSCLEDGQNKLTYRELAELVAGIRVALQKRVEPGSVVPIMLPRGAWFIAAALAVMGTGCAYLPIDPNLPRRRIDLMLEDFRSEAVLTWNGCVYPFGDHDIILVDDASPCRDCGASFVKPGMAELAYTIYTSGSMGIPKAVEVTHRSLTNLVEWHRVAYSVTPRDRALHTAGLSFDATVWELWPYLCAGATIVVAPDEIRVISDEVVEYARATGTSLAFLPTPVAEEVIRTPDADPSWRVLLTGGDRLRMSALPQGYMVANHYGPTEATVVTTQEIVSTVPANGFPPIGRPITGVQVALLSADGRQTTAVGDKGEILIGGVGVSRGYRNDQELTRERFVSLSGLPGRWYRSGDVGEMLPGNRLAFLGRVDHEQLKVRGYRVEASEIEAAIMTHRGIRNVAVTLEKRGIGSSGVLVACIVPDGTAPTVRELREHLRDLLPTAVIPSRLFITERLPLTPSGKIDRSRIGTLLTESRRNPSNGPPAKPE